MLALLAFGACAPIEEGSLRAEPGPAVQVYVGDELLFDASLSVGAESFRWSFGDGEQTLSSSDPQVRHVYDEPGHYTAVLEVFDRLGMQEVASRRVTAIHRPLKLRPRSSSALRATETGDRMWAVLPDFDRIAVLDPAAGAVVSFLAGCRGPSSVDWTEAQGLLAVACRAEGRVQLYLGVEAVLGAEIELGEGAQPTAVLFDPQGQLLFVVDHARGEVLAYDLRGDTSNDAELPLLWRSSPGPDLRGLAWSDGMLLISRWRSPDEAGRFWYGPDDGSGFVAGSLALDTSPDSDTTSGGVPSYLDSIAIRPDGRQWVFPSTQANWQRGPFRTGEALSHETTVRAVLSQVHWTPGVDEAPTEGRRRIFDDRGLARVAAYDPEGTWLYVAMLGMETVEIVDPFTLEAAGSIQGIGQGLDGLWVEPDGDGIWVLASLSRELVRYRLGEGGVLPEEDVRVDLRPEGEEVLEPDVLLGAQVFHRSADPRMSRDGYISCASCHLEGRGDGRTWDFSARGEGLRNTTSLLGLGERANTPLHWTGNFDELQDFEGDIRETFAGAGFLSEADWEVSFEPLGESKAGRSVELDALSAFVLSLDSAQGSPLRDEGELTAEAQRGEALFLSADLGCVDCHPPPHYTDSQWLAPGLPLLHDVGTLDAGSGQRLGQALTGLDTPSLRGLWDSAPYLHDGSAASLREVLVERNPEGLHGNTSTLDDEQIADLVAFLLQID